MRMRQRATSSASRDCSRRSSRPPARSGWGSQPALVVTSRLGLVSRAARNRSGAGGGWVAAVVGFDLADGGQQLPGVGGAGGGGGVVAGQVVDGDVGQGESTGV